jgi:REP element-mobilizing transposase RayT
MPQSLCTVAIHIVFATKYRQRFIEKMYRTRLHILISVVINNLGGVLVAVGSVHDHIHLLIFMPRDISIAKLVQKIKIASSILMKAEFGVHDFAWQRGYAAFSVNGRGVRYVKRYILNQEEHHKAQTLDSEMYDLIAQNETAELPLSDFHMEA